MGYASWEIHEDFAPRIDTIVSIGCDKIQCEPSLLDDSNISQSQSLSDIILQKYEFLAYETQRQRVLSAFQEPKTIRDKTNASQESEESLIFIETLFAMSVENSDSRLNLPPISSNRLGIVLYEDSFPSVTRIDDPSEILEIIARYIDLPPPQAYWRKNV
ncbi:hypothetical protein EHQ46_10855 [Leptospira yanagawae]|uniref:Uncharacterized protein n=1 Tax=Leptospira yanagawae TaxID=293069 RepID=A0ABY2M0Q3_9LEPT|nr:hypothetical protein EHQ46_10855 [Leptospira yanagawae]